MAELPNFNDGMHPAADNTSVATDTAENRNISYANEPKEYIAIFLFQPKNSGNNTDVAQTHYKILQEIKSIYPEVQVFDNYNEEINEFPPLKNYAEYLRHFNLQFVKHNEKKNRKSLYLCFHRIVTPISLGEIRRHTVISSLLRKVNTRLTTHLWKEDETRIANLGFHVGVDPTNFVKEDLEHTVRQKIAEKTQKNIKNIPRFQCAFTSPYLIDSDGNHTSSKSYDIQCKQQDAAELIKLLQKTYQEKPTFIFHKMRHENGKAYKNAIRKQNLYLSNSRVVPIQGVNEEVMFYLENELLCTPGILSVLRHKLSTTRGRWSIMTMEADFKNVCDQISRNLVNWTKKVAADQTIATETPESPPVGLAFRNQPYDDGSETSFQTYMSACSSLYSVEDNTHDFPPITYRPIPQAWVPPTPVPNQLNTTKITHSVSGISQDEFNRVTRENLKLTRKIEELTSKMTQWEQRQTQPQVQPMDLQSIIAATTKAVLETMTQLHLNPQQMGDQHHLQQLQGGANNSTDVPILDMSAIDVLNPDMSLDSEWTPKPNDRP